MRNPRTAARGALCCLLWLCCASQLAADDLTLHFAGAGAWTRTVVEYQCDARGVELGLPSGAFKVQYLNGNGNSLAIVPVSGQALIFANVWSASGARYAARAFIWWDAAGRTTLFESESPAAGAPANCRRTQAQ